MLLKDIFGQDSYVTFLPPEHHNPSRPWFYRNVRYRNIRDLPNFLGTFLDSDTYVDQDTVLHNMALGFDTGFILRVNGEDSKSWAETDYVRDRYWHSMRVQGSDFGEFRSLLHNGIPERAIPFSGNPTDFEVFYFLLRHTSLLQGEDMLPFREYLKPWLITKLKEDL